MMNDEPAAERGPAFKDRLRLLKSGMTSAAGPAAGLAAAAVALTLLALGAVKLTAGADFDYAGASEAEQQRILDDMAAGLEYGLARATGGALQVLETKADAGADLLSLDAQFVDRRFEAATDEHIAVLSSKMYADNCNFFMTRKVVEAGVEVRYRIARPSGRPLADFVFDRQSCAPFMRAAVD